MSTVTIGNSSPQIEIPNICPFCHVKQNPRQTGSVSYKIDATQQKMTINYKDYYALAFWLCANNECQKVFVCQYSPHPSIHKFVFNRFLNGLPKGPDWPKPIEDLKNGNDTNEQTRFIKTYLQSLEAENNGYDEIAGMGFRKAIEYLVKDWAISNNPDDTENIHKLWLGQVISKYYTGDLKDILDRATWLGNDQAHYNKLFEEYDLNDLKELIALIMVELDRQHKLKHYISNIQGKK